MATCVDEDFNELKGLPLHLEHEEQGHQSEQRASPERLEPEA